MFDDEDGFLTIEKYHTIRTNKEIADESKNETKCALICNLINAHLADPVLLQYSISILLFYALHIIVSNVSNDWDSLWWSCMHKKVHLFLTTKESI